MENINNEKIIKKAGDEELIGEVLFRQYKLTEIIGHGAFGTIYKCVTDDGKEFAAKIVICLYNIKIQEKLIDKKKASLELDTFFLDKLRGFGIPDLRTYGKIKDKKYYALIMEYLGLSLNDLFNEQNQKFSVKTSCILGIQMIDRIEFLHSKKYVHRDIKPANFLMGRGKKSHILYLCDFGTAKKYWTNHNHVEKKFIGRFSGTEKFASVNSLEGNQQSRKDDLMSIAYVLILFMKGSLPWDDIKKNDIKESDIKENDIKKNDIKENDIKKKKDMEFDRYRRLIVSKKKETKIEELCKGLPKEIKDFIWNIYNLKFEEVPNYKNLKNYLKDAIKNSGEELDCKYDWCTEQPKISEEDDIFKDHYNIDYESTGWLNYQLYYIFVY